METATQNPDETIGAPVNQDVTIGAPVAHDTPVNSDETIGAPVAAHTPVSSQPPAAQPSMRDDITNFLSSLYRPSIDEAKGFIKGGMKSFAGIIDTANTPMIPIKQADGSYARAAVPEVQGTTNTIRQHAQDNSRAQSVGDFGENMAELLLPEAWAGGAAKTLSFADRLAEMAKNAKILENKPGLAVIARAGIDAIKGTVKTAPVAGAQTWVKTEDPTATAVGALLGGAGGAVGEGGGTLIREGRAALNDLRPGTSAIGDVAFPTRKGRMVAPAVQPGTPDEVSNLADQLAGNIGRKGVAASLIRSNAERVPEAVSATSHMPLLPAPDMVTPGSAPSPNPAPRGYAPSVEAPLPPQTESVTYPKINNEPQPGAPDWSARTGDTLTGQRTVPNPNYDPLKGGNMQNVERELGSSAAAVPDRVMGGPRSASQVRLEAARNLVPERMVTGEPTATENYIYHTPPPPGSGGTITTSGGGMVRMSIPQAQASLTRYERIMDSPTFDDLPVNQQRGIRDAHEDLTEQLRRFDDFAASQPHFPIHNITDAINNTDDITAGGELLMDAHRPFWLRANALTDGQFTLLDNQAKGLRSAIRSDTSTTDKLSKLQDLKEVNDKIMQLFDDNRTQFNPQEWSTAKQGYKDGVAMQTLGDTIEAHFNGITRGDVAATAGSDVPLQRVFKGGSDSYNKSLQKLIDDPNDGPALQRTIGPDSIQQLKQLGDLFENGQRIDTTKKLYQYIGSAIKRHGWAVGGLGGTIGYGIGHGLGSAAGVAGAGVLGKGVVSGTSDWLTSQLSTNPEFAKSFIYAVKNNVGPRIAAPLLASMLLRGSGVQTPPPPPPPAPPGGPQ